MAVSMTLYGNFFKALFNKEVDLDSDSLKVMLCTSSYTPDKDTHDYKNDVTNEVTGTGYSAGGAAIANPAFSYITANSWATARANSTAYTAGQIVRPASGNGYLYQAVTAGTTAGSIPTYPTTIGGTVVDGGVTWVCVGRGALKFDGDDVAWAASTIAAARYGIAYDDTPATAATKPLIGYVDFGADVSTTNGTFSIPWSADGIFVVVVA